jgi:hypothetical protein
MPRRLIPGLLLLVGWDVRLSVPSSFFLAKWLQPPSPSSHVVVTPYRYKLVFEDAVACSRKSKSSYPFLYNLHHHINIEPLGISSPLSGPSEAEGLHATSRVSVAEGCSRTCALPLQSSQSPVTQKFQTGDPCKVHKRTFNTVGTISDSIPPKYKLTIIDGRKITTQQGVSNVHASSSINNQWRTNCPATFGVQHQEAGSFSSLSYRVPPRSSD